MLFIYESLISNKKKYFFERPIKIIRADKPAEIKPAFAEIEKYSKLYYLAGFISYEAGYLFDDFKLKINNTMPLLYFGVFQKNLDLEMMRNRNSDYKIIDIKLNRSKQKYANDFKIIEEHLKNGDTYQINYTQKIKFKISGDNYALYSELKKRQPVDYAAYIEFDDMVIISLSPELFFERAKNKITFKPMKGTAERGRNVFEDAAKKKNLLMSEKERAENLMIVDLIRNDAGRICKAGSVKTPALFSIEKYPTVFQMTSTVTGTLKKNIDYYEIFKATFPCGSVTGAPKFSSMNIIKKLERENRNIYCGSIGIIEPARKAVFSVAIRTVQIKNSNAELGIGGGITIDSLFENEYNESLLKAQFLTKKKNTDFKLIETLLFKKKYCFLSAHLKRMKLSAQFFNYRFNEFQIIKQLQKLKTKLDTDKSYKIRFLLNACGTFIIEKTDINLKTNEKHTKKIAVSNFKINSSDIFFYHKTTNRQLYETEYKKYSEGGFYDVIFLNEHNEITEGSFNNIFIEKNKILFTPPIDCGLLNGIYRNTMLRKKNVIEKKIKIQDLKNADKIFLCNSVRGMTEVFLIL